METAHDQYAVLWSGGKDSCLALWRAQKSGLRIGGLLNFFDEATGRVRFHAVRASLIAEQARSLGLELFQYQTQPETFATTFVSAFHKLKARGFIGIVAGDIYLQDVLQWNQDRASEAGLQLLEPLWQDDAQALLKSFVAVGFRAVLTCCNTRWPDTLWPGREIDEGFVTDVLRQRELDPCGENGEYHSFVFDGPLFSHSIKFVPGEIRRSDEFSQLDLICELEHRPVQSRSDEKSNCRST